MSNLSDLKKEPKVSRCYEMWRVNNKGHFVMIGTAYLNKKMLENNMKVNPHIQLVLHKGTIRMWCRFVVSRLFGFA